MYITVPLNLNNVYARTSRIAPCSPCSGLWGLWSVMGSERCAAPGSRVKWLTVLSCCWILLFVGRGAVTLVVKEQEKHKRSVTLRNKLRPGEEIRGKTHSAQRASERCSGIAHYFPGDRWQRLQMTGYWLRCQCISVNYDCNKTLCV